MALQRLLGGVRAALSLDCPRLESLDVHGLAGGSPAFQGRLSAAQGWQLEAVGPATASPVVAGPRPPPPASAPPPPPSVTTRPLGLSLTIPAALLTCEDIPQNPLIGCWLQLDPAPPARLHPAIMVFTSDGRMYGGSLAQLTSGQTERRGNWTRPRMVGMGHILDIRYDNGGFQQWQAPEFFEQCAIMMMETYGPEMFFGGTDGFVMARLNVRRLTPTILDDQRELERIGRLREDGDTRDACHDPGQPEMNDRLLPLLIGGLPAVAARTAIATRAFMPRLGQRVAARTGVASRPPSRPGEFWRDESGSVPRRPGGLSPPTGALSPNALAMLRQAERGVYRIGSANRADSYNMGLHWVGEGYSVQATRDGGLRLLSRDGLRQYRGPSVKSQNSGREAPTGVQSNFESRDSPTGIWTRNSHLDIED